MQINMSLIRIDTFLTTVTLIL